jgi:ectoine hydroxylase-related dioxygenase (phytanoyl-CoA dioxygenase family)
LLDREVLAQDGACIVAGVVEESLLREVIQAVQSLVSSEPRRRGGIRSINSLCAETSRLSASPSVMRLVRPVLGDAAFVARSILFDKTPDANWDVIWHQDTTIAVTQQHEVDGFGPWSVKGGVPHVQPPVRVLQNMLTLRIHLDPCGPENGPLLIVPGSHTDLVPDSSIDAAACDRAARPLCCGAGDVIMMRPLVLHASRRASHPGHRRVLHLEFAAEPLPAPLKWACV